MRTSVRDTRPLNPPTRWGLLVLLAALGACGGDESAAVAAKRALLAEGCSVNTDCSAPLVCAFRTCHVECKTSRDCDAGLLCVPSEKPFYVCQLPSEVKCTYNSQCPGTLVCGVDGKCRQECASAKDCLAAQACTQGTCAETTELSNGLLPVAQGGSSQGSPCVYAKDCAENLVCKGGACLPECLDDRDCDSPEVCIGGVCKLPPPADGSTPPPAYGKGCNLNSDCGAGLVCGKSGLCVYACNADADCSGGCCVGHACVGCGAGGSGGAGGTSGGAGSGGAPGGAAGSAGTGAGGGGPCDADGDGYQATGACGGTDCDDTKDTVHPTAKELCDGLDNNCNGTVDEGVWQASAPVEVLSVDACTYASPSLAVIAGNPPRPFLVASDCTTSALWLQELQPATLTAKGAPVKFGGDPKAEVPFLASSGSRLAFAGVVNGGGGNTVVAASFDPASPPGVLPKVSTPSGDYAWWVEPRVVWTGSAFHVLWADAHDGTRRVYRSTATEAGAFSFAQSPFTSSLHVAGNGGDSSSLAVLAVGATAVGVAHSGPTDLWFSTFGLSSAAGAILQPVASPQLAISDVVAAGSGWIAAGGTDNALHLVAFGTDGKPKAKRSAGTSVLVGRLASLDSGVVIATHADLGATLVRVLVLPPDLGTHGDADPANDDPVPTFDVPAPGVFRPVPVVIDPKHVGVTWQAGTKVMTTVLTCAD